MQIQVNTDSNIEGDNALNRQVETTLRETLDHFSKHITRVEVHLRDENSASKSGTEDKRCLLEVRLRDHQPIAVSHHASTLDQAVDGAAKKMKRLLVSTFGRLDNR